MSLPTERPDVNRSTTQTALMRRLVSDIDKALEKRGIKRPSYAGRPWQLMPPGLKLRDRRMPLDVDEFFTTMVGADPAAKAAAIGLMARSWREVPCGSLPNDPEKLCEASRVSPKVWRRVRATALLPFTLCCDGRWHCHLLVEPLTAICRQRAAKEPRVECPTEPEQPPIGRPTVARWRQTVEWFHWRSTAYHTRESVLDRGNTPTPTPTLSYPITKVGTDAARARPTATDPTPTRPKGARQDHERAAAPLPTDWQPAAADIAAVKLTRPDLDDLAIERQARRFVERYAGEHIHDHSKRFIAFASKGFGKPWVERPSATAAARTTGDARSSEPDEIVEWRARLRGYRPDRMWIWGPRPGEPGCLVPLWLLVELGVVGSDSSDPPPAAED